MRSWTLRALATLTVAFAIFTAGPAAAAWQTYLNEPLGFSVMFPGKPTEGKGMYRSDLVPEGVTDFVSFKDGDASFVAMVIQTGRNDDGAIVMGEFEYWLGHFGEMALNNVSRLNIGMEYGRFMSLDCSDSHIPEGVNQGVRARQMFKDAAGIVCPDGARLTTTLYFNQGRLYAAMGIQAGEDAKLSGAPGRFANSLNWEGANEVRARTMVDWVRVNASKAVTMGTAPPAAGAAPPAEGGGR